MLEILAWVCMAGGVSGAWLNAQKNIWCWYVWIPANTGWIVYFVSSGQWASATLFFVYLVIAVHGLMVWRKDDEQ